MSNILDFPTKKDAEDQGLMDCPDCGNVLMVLFLDGIGCYRCRALHDVDVFYTQEIVFEPDDAS